MLFHSFVANNNGQFVRVARQIRARVSIILQGSR